MFPTPCERSGPIRPCPETGWLPLLGQQNQPPRRNPINPGLIIRYTRSADVAAAISVSTRQVEKLAESLGVTQLSKSQVSTMTRHLDEQVAAFRNRPLDQGPYAFVWVDALTQKVREGGRIINVHALISVGVNVDGHREILGIDVATAEDGVGWLAFLRSLIARGLSGVQMVISDAHAGLVDASGAVLPGASWLAVSSVTTERDKLPSRAASVVGRVPGVRVGVIPFQRW